MLLPAVPSSSTRRRSYVFGQHGVTAPLDLVVERAQVGRATLYRNFPDRTALIQALLQRTVDRIRRQVEPAR